MNRILHLAIYVGLTVLLLAGPSGVQAATAPAKAKAKPTPAKAPAKAAPHPGISQNPYIGAIVVDAATGRVLFEDKADAKGYPASVLKLMDLLILLEKIEAKQLSFLDQVTVSAKAAKTGGSQVYLAEKEVFTVDELLYALMVKSANDAAVALTEKAAGSTEAFVELMNQRAKQLGMNNTLFHSVHGLPPGAGQSPDVTTARDFSILCREVLKHPDTLRYSSTRAHPFRPNGKTIDMVTHNHLMAMVQGCDGLKTGFFTQAGFSIAVTAARNGQRLIVVMLGSADRKVRDAKAAELVARGFAAFAAVPAPAPQAAPAAAVPAQKAKPAKP